MRRQRAAQSMGAILFSTLVAAVLASPVAVADQGILPTAALASARTVDLALALGADGAFRGAPGAEGTVDASAWTLVSDLAAGEPPRFAPAARRVSPATSGTWSALGSNGHGNGALADRVRAIAVSGSTLYVGGDFTDAAGIPTADHIARWSGGAWSALGSNGHGDGALNNHYVFALAVSGPILYVGGDFTDAAGIATADHVARWNGSAWSALGSNGSGNGAINNTVYALAVSGSDLYAGGYFTDAAGILTADFVARWNGSAWSALGSNGAGNGAICGDVDALAVSASGVYVGGNFIDVAGIPTADFVARWNGSAWSALGSNGHGDGALNNWVHALAVSGTDVYVGGYFYNAAGITTADDIAKWNGSAWSALGSNGHGDGAIPGDVEALVVSGPGLFVGGTFGDIAGVVTADYIVKWSPGSAVVLKPDGRIRLGTGAFVGNDVYNATGANQSRTGSAARGKTVSFGISVQNDGTAADSFKVKATGDGVSGYSVKFFSGATDITAAVVAGTYRTPSLAPTRTYLINAKVTVKSTAAVGSKITRLVTITSLGDSTRKDAVRFIAKRT